MKLFKIFVFGFLLAVTPLALTACEDQGPLEEAGEEIDDEIDDATTN